MSITLEQIAEYEERLRAEIVQRECLLAALGVFRTYSAKGKWPDSLDLGSLTSALVQPVHELQIDPAPLPAPAPPSLPDVPPPKPYMHPELEELIRHRHTNVAIVRWAIGRMTHDFSLHEIRKVLKREGYPLEGPEISVVLTRMKRDGYIEEAKRAQGSIGAIFRKPEPGFAEATHRPQTAQSRLERVLREQEARMARLKAATAQPAT